MTVIKNSDALAVTDLRKDALAIVEAGYAAIAIDKVIKRNVRVAERQLHIGSTTYPLAGRRVYVVGVGKGAIHGGCALESLLGDALTGGIVLDVSPAESSSASKLGIFVGTHPLPSETNAAASEHILEFLSGREESDLVIMLISGGGSTLLSLPVSPMSIADERALFETLTARGAPIQDLNIVRKHISRARGGALAVASYPAEVVALIVSDVPGDDLAIIASGPTVRDTTTVADAQAILKRYVVPAPTEIAFLETTKDEKFFTRVTNTLLLSSHDSLAGMQEAATNLGYAVRIVDARFTGEAREVAHAITHELHQAAPKTALLYAGESTVTLGASNGKGGRNQELALAALEDIRTGELLLPFASDGRDNTDHAGAIADEVSRRNANTKQLSILEYLEAHRSYDFFSATGDSLVTGPSASNVSDLIIALKA
jgi:glycerate 2-kinase